MKRLLIVLIFAALACSFAPVMAEENKGTETMVVFGGSSGDVVFTHHQHQTLLRGDCQECHKLFSQEKGGIQKAISMGKLSKKTVMNNCVACHKEAKKQGKDNVPITCKQCHKK